MTTDGSVQTPGGTTSAGLPSDTNLTFADIGLAPSGPPEDLEDFLRRVLLYTVCMREWAADRHVRRYWKADQGSLEQRMGELDGFRQEWAGWARRLTEWADGIHNRGRGDETHIRPPKPPY